LRAGEEIRRLAFVAESRFEPVRKVRGWLYLGKIPENEKRATNLCIVSRASLAFSNVPLHANQLDARESIVYERDVLITKLATIHGDRLRVR
jgi:hypothetical protein